MNLSQSPSHLVPSQKVKPPVPSQVKFKNNLVGSYPEPGTLCRSDRVVGNRCVRVGKG